MSKRLEVLKSFYQQTEIVYDLYCDHGLLGISLLQEKKLKQCYFIDSSEYVIDKLKLKMRIFQNEKVFIKRKEVHNLILKPHSKTIFFAGVGGYLIAYDFLSNIYKQLKRGDHLIVCAHSHRFELRSFFHYLNLYIHDEVLLYDQGVFYEIWHLALHPSAKGSIISLYGDKIWNYQDLSKFYLEKLRNHYQFSQNLEFADLKTFLNKLSL